MAKTKTELTPTQIAANKAREAYNAAKEAHDKSQTDKNKVALDKATTERNTAVTAENRERFLRIGGARVTKAISSLANVGKLAAPRSYEYSEEDVAKLESAITSAAKNAIQALRAAKQKGGGKSAVAGFTFE